MTRLKIKGKHTWPSRNSNKSKAHEHYETQKEKTEKTNANITQQVTTTAPTANTENVAAEPKKDVVKNNTNQINDSANEFYIKIRNESQKLSIPNISSADFSNIRNRYQKGFNDLTGEPGWFYFKIYFKFNTVNGLLGNSLKFSNIITDYIDARKDNFHDESKSGYNKLSRDTGGYDYDNYSKTNCAVNFLINNYSRMSERIPERITALKSFAELLSFITTKSPWCFSGITGLQDALKFKFDQPVEKEKALTIECSNEMLDFRLNTLSELYRFICYDYMMQKEIVPENLRKFDLTVAIMNVPVRYFQTELDLPTSALSNFGVKGLSSPGFKNTINKNTASDSLSVRVFNFINCEFDLESLVGGFWNATKNETPFQTKPSFKINYGRVYSYIVNEWLGLVVGDYGMQSDFKNFENKKTNTTQSAGDFGNTLKSIKSEFKKNYSMSNFKEMLGIGDNSSESARKRLIREKLMGDGGFSNSLINFGEQILDSAIGSFQNQYTLGNIYHDGWVQTGKKLFNAFETAKSGDAINAIDQVAQSGIFGSKIGGIIQTWSPNGLKNKLTTGDRTYPNQDLINNWGPALDNTAKLHTGIINTFATKMAGNSLNYKKLTTQGMGKANRKNVVPVGNVSPVYSTFYGLGSGQWDLHDSQLVDKTSGLELGSPLGVKPQNSVINTFNDYKSELGGLITTTQNQLKTTGMTKEEKQALIDKLNKYKKLT